MTTHAITPRVPTNSSKNTLIPLREDGLESGTWSVRNRSHINILFGVTFRIVWTFTLFLEFSQEKLTNYPAFARLTLLRVKIQDKKVGGKEDIWKWKKKCKKTS